MTTLGVYWLTLHVAAIVCYVPLTLNCFKTKKSNRFSSPYAFLALWASSLVTPFIALAQPGVWSFIGLSAALWWVLMLYDTALASTITPDNPGLIAYLLPLMSWLLSWPIAVLTRIRNPTLLIAIGIAVLLIGVWVWRERAVHQEFLRKYGVKEQPPNKSLQGPRDARP